MQVIKYFHRQLYAVKQLLLVISTCGGLSLLAQGDEPEKLTVQVNKRTLNLFIPVEHMVLPCFIPIEVRSNYNSYANDSSLFGARWSFNYSTRVRIQGSTISVIEGDGFESAYAKEKTLEEAKQKQIEALMIARKKVDVKAGGLKSESTYREFKERLEREAPFREEQAKKLLPAPTKPAPGIYYTYSRSPSTLEIKANGTFLRRYPNGSTESFNTDGALLQVADRHGNKIDFAYLGKRLAKINDSCGRSLTFSYSPNKAQEDLIVTVRDSLNRSVHYTYHPDRMLKSFKSIRGELFEFEYDKQGFMTLYSRTLPSKKKDFIRIVYSTKFEVEKEIHSSGEEILYKRTFVANNQSHSVSDVTKKRDGKIASREVIESKTKEFEVVTRYNAAGQQTAKETKKFSAITGYPESKLDQNGAGELTTYDPTTGNLIRRELVPQGVVLTYTYDAACNQVTSIKTQQGPKTIGESRFKFDKNCSLIHAADTANNQARLDISVEWGKQGRITFLRDKASKRDIAFTYWKYGKPDSITLRDTGALIVKYSPLGDIENVDTKAHGAGVKRYEKMDQAIANGLILNEVKAALDDLLGFIRPTGVNVGL